MTVDSDRPDKDLLKTSELLERKRIEAIHSGVLKVIKNIDHKNESSLVKQPLFLVCQAKE